MYSRPIQVDPTGFLPPAVRDSFREGLRAGDVDRLRHMLENEPLMSHAQSWEREMPLFIASVHSDAHKAVQMIDLLMERGAWLGRRSLGAWNVLMLACHRGVDWIVVECLMKWNALEGGKVLDWSHGSGTGNSPLLLACWGGHTQLVLRILDEMDMEEYSPATHPFDLLEEVIAFGDEAHALAIAEHPKIQAAVKDPSKYFLSKYHRLPNCVARAVKREMADVLRLLDNWNHPTVSKAMWHFTFTYSEEQEKLVPQTTNAVILGLTEQFAKDRRWENVRGILLLRHRGLDAEMVDGQLRADLLVGLPDSLFRLVVGFIKPSMARRSEVDRIETELLMY